MGGYGSGRRGHRKTIGESLRIEFPFLKSRRYFKDNGAFGTIEWNSRGSKTGEISIKSVLNPITGIGELILTFSIGDEPQKQRIALEGTPMRFGGFTYYARCPISWQKCRTLVFSPPHKKFISVKSSGLLYTSQTESPFDRLGRKRDKAEKAYNKLSKFARKPTKERIKKRYFSLDSHWERQFNSILCRLEKRGS